MHLKYYSDWEGVNLVIYCKEEYNLDRILEKDGDQEWLN